MRSFRGWHALSVAAGMLFVVLFALPIEARASERVAEVKRILEDARERAEGRANFVKACLSKKATKDLVKLQFLYADAKAAVNARLGHWVDLIRLAKRSPYDDKIETADLNAALARVDQFLAHSESVLDRNGCPQLAKAGLAVLIPYVPVVIEVGKIIYEIITEPTAAEREAAITALNKLQFREWSDIRTSTSYVMNTQMLFTAPWDAMRVWNDTGTTNYVNKWALSDKQGKFVVQNVDKPAAVPSGFVRYTGPIEENLVWHIQR
jgi:hypothetical protein